MTRTTRNGPETTQPPRNLLKRYTVFPSRFQTYPLDTTAQDNKQNTISKIINHTDVTEGVNLSVTDTQQINKQFGQYNSTENPQNGLKR